MEALHGMFSRFSMGCQQLFEHFRAVRKKKRGGNQKPQAKLKAKQ